MLAWRMGRTPPSHIESEEDQKNWATTVSIARFWVMTVAIKKSRISANRLKVSALSRHSTVPAPLDNVPAPLGLASYS